MPDEFAPDCSNCAALCCVTLAFDKGESFGHDKPAGLPCHNLSDDFRCRIHADLAREGYHGCIAFDCLGAGQRVTALFSQNWRERPEALTEMMDAFRQMRAVQSLRQMLEAAVTLPLPPLVEAERREMAERLAGAVDDLALLEAFRPEPIRKWIKGLAQYASP
ncbi:hypothetical protein [Celeribacter litoreus]|uniref:hypothetical protein n=1 Tax=Celeribacter litoreus TaxID=2876714 RepID=UPI001CCFF3CF|nr:hypothetical protein [Celeribacter litoreus]MCA0044171.1 hypothetical protein [Celeribacter litoreus]